MSTMARCTHWFATSITHLEILHKIQKHAKWARAWKIFYWTILIALTIGSYYVIQPYVDQLGESYGLLKTRVESIHSIGDTLQNISQ